jgi:adenylate cyclase
MVARCDLTAVLRRRASLAAFLVNLAGALSLGVYMLVVYPLEGEDSPFLKQGIGLGAVALFTVIGGLTAYRSASPWFASMREWLGTGGRPTPEQCRAVLQMPARYARMTAVRWLAAVVVFGAVDLSVSVAFAREVAVATVLAGLTATAAVYLAIEWIMRPAFARALAHPAPPDTRSLGIGRRLLLTWLLCSGVPVLMLALIPVARDVDDPHTLVAPTMFAAAMALVTGFVATKLATMAVTRPVRSLRRAVDAVAEGDLGVTVPVDDGSEIGRLQAGFNAMVDGLRERERLRDLYGRQVGSDVARAALEQGAELGGRRAEISALYVDVIGSTSLAEREAPERVVGLLNDFFAAVVDVVDAHGGLVNKFEGDAALCVFGAPVADPDHAGSALAAARELHRRLRALDGGLDAAIGVASGAAVAGYVGAETRFEYTVIGDAVNESARLSEVAKRRPGRLLASAAALERAGRSESARWRRDGEIVLRGRSTPTRLAIPVGVERPHSGPAAIQHEPAG